MNSFKQPTGKVITEADRLREVEEIRRQAELDKAEKERQKLQHQNEEAAEKRTNETQLADLMKKAEKAEQEKRQR